MKKILMTIITVLTPILMFAHTPDISIKDNKDGTFTVHAQFANGDSTEGSIISVVYDKPYNGSSENVINGNLVLFEKELDENGTATLYKPKTKKYYLNIYVMVAHEYTRYDVPVLTDGEKEVWEKKITEDKELTKDEKDYLLGNKKD
ncbi:hypothetical protein [Oceanivirga salmonicida]|uniref:hypothetical protein n=1 Tax=Oceanivirga salmonicida TaxID=1769291 RepID=UPI00082CDFDC|nr:hypothetical protein [Oceanivirga salmonicida]